MLSVFEFFRVADLNDIAALEQGRAGNSVPIKNGAQAAPLIANVNTPACPDYGSVMS